MVLQFTIKQLIYIKEEQYSRVMVKEIKSLRTIKKNRLNYLSRFMHFSRYIASKLNSQQTFLIFITSWKVKIVTLKTSLRRRLQCKNMSSFKTSSRRLQDVLVNVLQVLLKDVFKKLSCKHVFKTSWKTKKCYPEDVFNKYSTCLHQDDFAGLIVSFK